MDQAEKKLAKKIAIIAAAAGDSGSADVVTALKKFLEPKTIAQRKEFSKTFMRYLKSELKKSEVIIEHAGEISDKEVSEILEQLQKKADRKLTAKKQQNADLIAGLRISLADNVYDMSVAGRLNNLSATIK